MIPTQFQILDTRIPLDFRDKSFSGYSITNIATALNKELNNGDIEKAALIAIELLEHLKYMKSLEGQCLTCKEMYRYANL